MPKLHYGRLIWLWVSAVVILLDQLAKWFALSHLHFQTPVVVADGFFNWFLDFNTGAAFSLLGHTGPWHIVLLFVLAIVVCGALLVWVLRANKLSSLTVLSIALIMGGAIGNLIDRARFGHVVDFIQWHFKGYYWPTFNIADSAICLGAVLLILTSLLGLDNGHSKRR